MAKQLTAHYRRYGAPFRVLTVEVNGATPTRVLRALNAQREAGTREWERVTRVYASRFSEYMTVDRGYYNRDTGCVQDFRTGEVIR